jgi:flagellin-specific chaperone FliS
MKNFKEEELIMYLYQDCTPALSKAIDKAILEDAELKKQVETLKRSKDQLDKLKLKSPSKKSIKAILDYARKKEN